MLRHLLMCCLLFITTLDIHGVLSFSPLPEGAGVGVRTLQSPLPPGQHDLSLEHDGLTRTFRVYVPENLPPTPVPLAIIMHGAGGDGAGMERMTRFDDLADAYSFIVVYPDGINTIWNDGRLGDSRVPTELDDVGFLSAMIDLLAARLPVDTARVYAAGYSMGGMMAFRLGCDLHDKIAAIASVASTFPGYLLTNCETVPPIPVLIIQGTRDEVIPWDGVQQGAVPVYLSTAQSAVYWAVTNGCEETPDMLEGVDVAPEDSTLVRHIFYNECQNQADVEVFAIIGGGHTWPGTPLAVRGGAVSYDLYASAAVWQFFERHSIIHE